MGNVVLSSQNMFLVSKNLHLKGILRCRYSTLIELPYVVFYHEFVHFFFFFNASDMDICEDFTFTLQSRNLQLTHKLCERPCSFIFFESAVSCDVPTTLPHNVALIVLETCIKFLFSNFFFPSQRILARSSVSHTEGKGNYLCIHCPLIDCRLKKTVYILMPRQFKIAKYYYPKLYDSTFFNLVCCHYINNYWGWKQGNVNINRSSSVLLWLS